MKLNGTPVNGKYQSITFGVITGELRVIISELWDIYSVPMRWKL